MHTYIIYFRGFVVGSQSLLTWGFVQGRAVRRRHCVGGGAPPFPKYRGARRGWRKVFDLEDFDLGFCPGERPAPTSLCRRPPARAFWSAAGARRHNWRRRRGGAAAAGGGAAAQKNSSKFRSIFEIFLGPFYSSKIATK